MKKSKVFKELKDIDKFTKEQHEKQVNKSISQVYDSDDFKMNFYDYQQAKKLRWIGWLIVFLIFIIGSLIGVLVGYLTLNVSSLDNWKGINYFNVLYTTILFFIGFIIGVIKNRQATKFFNDRRRRYQKTLELSEAKLIRLKKIFYLSGLLMLILTIILFLVFKI
ncbi:Conserved hypothetical protein, predicted transmembrane protein [Mycoplasma mycoides subsp. capri LC str. 95010]|uniref:Uncharacterized protein n=1 Tax=Mycoplasma mycoides subsp. capri LC str. 95010 TaxID=862259 RepID=F4MP52_MYCML|nr:hypothetical protein [Mycoplasma mycoides]CBW53884.1 Conserved hypothetical protein, predicted transmembrane protein [Mycoplasma mycoides subsp. capri LC str. 95010]